jgi:hypothetical protein
MSSKTVTSSIFASPFSQPRLAAVIAGIDLPVVPDPSRTSGRQAAKCLKSEIGDNKNLLAAVEQCFEMDYDPPLLSL